MAPLLRHRAGRSFPDGVSLPRPSTTTLVSGCGNDHADRSFLLIRERSPRSAAGHRLILRGIFDQALHARLHTVLATVSRSETPLTLDLREVTFLDESCLRLLLRARREHSQVIFQVPSAGPVAHMINALGVLPKSLPVQRTIAAPVLGRRLGNEKLSAQALLTE